MSVIKKETYDIEIGDLRKIREDGRNFTVIVVDIQEYDRRWGGSLDLPLVVYYLSDIGIDWKWIDWFARCSTLISRKSDD